MWAAERLYRTEKVVNVKHDYMLGLHVQAEVMSEFAMQEYLEVVLRMGINEALHERPDQGGEARNQKITSVATGCGAHAVRGQLSGNA